MCPRAERVLEPAQESVLGQDVHREGQLVPLHARPVAVAPLQTRVEDRHIDRRDVPARHQPLHLSDSAVDRVEIGEVDHDRVGGAAEAARPGDGALEAGAVASERDDRRARGLLDQALEERLTDPARRPGEQHRGAAVRILPSTRLLRSVTLCHNPSMR